jgi:mannose PTS system EIIAB component
MKVLRIDERLIHGQIVIGWSKVLDTKAIVVANDSAANDEIQSVSLKMAAPNSVKVAIKTVKDAIDLLNDDRAKGMNILAIVNSPQDALQVVEGVKDIAYVNVGNFGRMERQRENRKCFGASLYLNEHELEIIDKIRELKPDSTYQMTDKEKKVMLKDLF